MSPSPKPDIPAAALFASTPPQNPYNIADWRPTQRADIGLRIAADGTWFYRDSPVARRQMVKFFASLLRFEDDDYFLITPRLKYFVAVDEMPFVAVEMRREGEGRAQKLYFRSNTDDVVSAGRAHPIVVGGTQDQPQPSVEIRAGLRAKLTRAVFYELAQLAGPSPYDANVFGVYGNGEFFALTPP